MYRIIAVCTGNICRSPMAEFSLARAFSEAGLGSEVRVESAGISDWEAGRPMDDRAADELLRHGFEAGPLRAFRARMFEAGWFPGLDLILALDHGHLEYLQALAPNRAARDKIRLLRSFDPAVSTAPGSPAPAALDIEDPWYGDRSDFDSAFTLIEAAVPSVVRHVRTALDSRAGSGR